ncbi:MAG TPA: VOC family protein [Thermomonospora sp.]|nr:VOC family protein [Thermomonospora sp.]
MASRLNPYVMFDGNARQAMEFYRDVLGGDLAVNTYAEMGETDPARAEKVMHAMLETPSGFTLMASDLPPGAEHRPGNNVTISLSGDDDAELRGYWEKLCEGGTVSVPLEKQMWGDVFGACTDRFGIEWMVDIGTEE